MEEDIGNLYLAIGTISRPKGLKGELKASFYDADYYLYLKDVKTFFIKEDGIMLPYFVKELYKINTNLACVKIEGIDNRQKAYTIINKEIFIHRDILQKRVLSHNNKNLQLLGFIITDVMLGRIGVINDIIKYPHQNLASLIYKERSVLIPLAKEFIVDINYDNKCIKMELPAGLLDI